MVRDGQRGAARGKTPLKPQQGEAQAEELTLVYGFTVHCACPLSTTVMKRGARRVVTRRTNTPHKAHHVHQLPTGNFFCSQVYNKAVAERRE